MNLFRETVVRGRGGQLLGSLVLYRGPDDPEFTAADERQLADLLPLVARGLEWAPPGPGDAYCFGSIPCRRTNRK